jgi:5-formyltetrahydrofolate cyclo-ligase
MNLDESSLKQKLRAELRARLRLISPERRSEYSKKVCAFLQTQQRWAESRSILFYSPLLNEIDILPLMQECMILGKIIILPRFHPESECYILGEVKDLERDLVPAKFGILEPRDDRNPFPAKHLDFALVPGVGFDPSGARLGRGRGYYDRLLAQVSGVKCGVAFDEQIVPIIPTAPHDIKMNFVLTPTRWLTPTAQS